MDFSEIEKKALERFVTSADDPIYACRSDLPPEVFGAFGSFFSRNPKDLREHILDANLGRIKDHTVDDNSIGQGNLKKLAEGEFESPAEALASGLSKSQDFFKKWYGKYSHKSIANTVWIPFVGNNVSQLFARQLAFDQLAFFIEQSTRFVKFDVENLYLDPKIMKSKHKELYLKTLKKMGQAYDQFTDLAADHYGKELTFYRWLRAKQSQSNVVLSDEREQKIAYIRELKAKAFDIARLLLPQAVRTNIAWILDARSTEFDIAAWKGHPLDEIVKAAEFIEHAGGQIAPSLLKYTGINPYYTEQYNGLEGAMEMDLDSRIMEKGVDIISYDKDALDKTIAMLLMRNNRSASFGEIINYVKTKLDFEDKILILDNVTKRRGRFDEWVDVEEAFDSLGITVQFKTDIGAVRDLRRHQKWDRNEGRYTLDGGFYLPEVVGEMGIQAVALYTEVMDRAYDTEKTIRPEFPFESQYVIPMAAFHPMVISGGLDQFQYLVATRSTPQGHFSYRQDAYNLAEAVCKVHPWILGLQEYPKCKKIEDVVRDAPLKGVLRPYLGDTGDRKSTRLNSSHSSISYAVFCL